MKIDISYRHPGVRQRRTKGLRVEERAIRYHPTLGFFSRPPEADSFQNDIFVVCGADEISMMDCERSEAIPSEIATGTDVPSQ